MNFLPSAPDLKFRARMHVIVGLFFILFSIWMARSSSALISICTAILIYMIFSDWKRKIIIVIILCLYSLFLHLLSGYFFLGHERNFFVRVLEGTRWAAVQQFILLGFFAYYLKQIINSDFRSAVASGFIFSLVHLPNPLLTILTFIAGFFFAFAYYKFGFRVILATAPFHAFIAVVIKIYFPFEWHRNLRVGIHYLN